MILKAVIISAVFLALLIVGLCYCVCKGAGMRSRAEETWETRKNEKMV